MHRFPLAALPALLAACVTASPTPPATQPSSPQASPSAPSPSAGPRHFRILHINDVYKVEGLEGGRIGGLARVRTLRTKLGEDGTPVLLLHAGDMLFPSVMGKYLLGQPMIRVMNLLDGDATAFDKNLVVTFGNHEFDNSDPGVLLGRTATSDFHWVSSNTRYCEQKGSCRDRFSARTPNVVETLVVDEGGVKVGIFGLVLDNQRQDYVAYEYAPEARRAVIRSAIDALHRDGAQLIIALTHQDMDEDVALASEYPEVDLVVGGHDHLYQQKQVGNTWVSKADADAKSALVYDVEVPPSGKPRITPRQVMLDASVPKDPVVEAEVQKSLKQLEGKMGPNVVVGTTENLLEGVEPAVRGRETALGNFLSDVLRARMKSDIAFVNGGAIRINDNIAPGPIHKTDMEGIFYFSNKVVDFSLTGAELLDLLRSSVSRVYAGDGRFLQVAGIRFRYHPRSAGDHPTYEINPSDVQVQRQGDAQFRPLDVNARYTAATLDYLWKSGVKDGYPLFAQGEGGKSPALLHPDDTPDWRKTTEDAIAALPDRKVTTRIEGRILAE